MKKPLVLCILDGCGIREETDGNAFKNATKPTFDYLWNNYPHSLLEASGEAVGLPLGQIGTSEVGHMTIGSGRTVYQPIEVINRAIADKSFNKNEEILNLLEHVKKHDSNLHVIGLLSDGGVHSSIDHLFALIDLLRAKGIKKVYYHLFTDGRDTNYKSTKKYVEALIEKIETSSIGEIATITGRHYGMDRDNNYDRVEPAYEAIVNGIGPKYDNVIEAIDANYESGLTDEFILPSVIKPIGIADDDGVITFNFRKDRLRELFVALTNPTASPLKTKDLKNLKVLTMFPVTEQVKCPYAFVDADLKNGFGEYIHKNSLAQLRIAETEKYAHVTYFFDGGEEKEYDDMKKILIPSPKVATYDLMPEMSAHKITKTLLSELEKDIYDVVILNFANGDMVGHTGKYDKAIEAVETMDECLGEIFACIEKKGGLLVVTADHGNCDTMWDENHQPVTSHTLEKVPFVVCQKGFELESGTLADIAPTLLDLLGLVKPREMTGKSLKKR